MKKKTTFKKYFIIISAIFIGGLIIAYSCRFIYYYLKENTGSVEDGEKITYFSDTLEATINVSDATGGLYLNGTEYLYKYAADNNYLWYSGHLWRILKINADKTLELISNDGISLIHDQYEETDYIKDYLNKFYDDLDPEYIVEIEYCSDKLSDVKNITCNDKKSSNITLLDLSTYNKAGGNKSFLNNGTYYWLMNQNLDNEYWFINNDGSLSYSKETHAFYVRPVIRLKSSLKLLEGEGTKDNPYVLKKNDRNIISGAYVGDYLTYNNVLWRISAITENYVSISSNECLKENDECMLRAFGNSNTYENSTIYKYLNETYYNSLENKDFIVKDNFYIGTYNKYDYKSVSEKSIQAYVGLSTVGDYFLEGKNNSFLITPNIIDTIYTINELGNYYLVLPSEKRTIYPVLNIDNTLKISTGSGTKNDPYTVSW